MREGGSECDCVKESRVEGMRKSVKSGGEERRREESKQAWYEY